jgi:sec-independent protein translocase protein TatA
MGLDNPLHIAFLVVILLLVFGARRLPEIGRSLGSGMREFKDSVTGASQQNALPPAPQQQAAAPAPAPAAAAAQPAAQPVAPAVAEAAPAPAEAPAPSHADAPSS